MKTQTQRLIVSGLFFLMLPMIIIGVEGFNRYFLAVTFPVDVILGIWAYINFNKIIPKGDKKDEK